MTKVNVFSVGHADADCGSAVPLLENLEPRLLLTTVSLALSPASYEITEAGGAAAVFTVSRDNTVGDLTVNYRVGGSEPVGKIAENLTGTVVIPAGSTSATISATPIDDHLAGYNNTLTIQLLDPDGNSYSLGTTSQGTVRIDESDSLLGRYITVGPGKQYADPWAAIKAIPTNSGIFIDVFPSATGQYVMTTGDSSLGKVSANNVTIRGIGEGRVKMWSDPSTQIANQKGIIVFQAGKTNFTMENLDLEGARYGTDVRANGAGLRAQGENWTVRNCYFANNNDGILSDGTASNDLIEYSEFYDNGIGGDGHTHNLYISTGTGSLTFQYNYSHEAYIGHLLKSRARVNYILYNRFQGGLSESYEINLPDAGKSYIVGNIIRQDPKTSNGGIIDYASESTPQAGDYLYIVGNTVVNDRPGGGTFVQANMIPAGFNVTIENNIFAGPGTPWSLANGVVPTTSGNVINQDISALKFVDPANFNYHLLPGSPAIGAAVDPGASVDGISLAPARQYIRENGVTTRFSAADAGAYEYPVSFSGTLWYDADLDGVMDPGETPLAGMKMNYYLDANGNGVADAGELTGQVTTDAQGRYTVTNIKPGHFVMSVANAYAFTAGNTVDVAAGNVLTGVNFGLEMTTVADPGSVSLSENGSGSGQVTADGDPEGSLVTFALATAPLHGTLTFRADGHFIYTPENNWNGTDSFQFQACDGYGLGAPATMSLVVTPVNEAPTAIAPDDVAWTDEDVPAIIPLGGSDVETAPADLLYVITTNPSHGKVTVSGSVATYTPDPDYNGPDSFAFTVTDNGDLAGSHANPGDLTSEPATVDVGVRPVNDRPTAIAPDGVAWTSEDGDAITIYLSGSDVETPTADLLYVITTKPSHGQVTLEGNVATYTPYADYNGPDSFAFTVTDNGDPAGGDANPGDLTSLPATVSLGIGPINDPPTAVAPDALVQTNEDSPIVIPLSGLDVETPSADLLYIVTAGPSHGTVTFDRNLATYTPDPNYNGPDSFAFTVTDNGDPAGTYAGPGVLTSEPVTVDLSVRPVNDAPTANDLDLLVKQNQDNLFILSGSDVETETQDLVCTITLQPSHGTITIAGNQATYTPFTGYYGPDLFQYALTDTGDPDGNPSGRLTSAPGTVNLAVAKVVFFGAKHPQTLFVAPNSPSGLNIAMTGPGTGELLLTNFDDVHSHDIARVELDGATTATGLTIKAVGKAAPAATVDQIVVGGSAKSITLAGVQVGGGLQVAGSLGKLDARLIQPGAAIEVGPAGWSKKGTQYKLGQVSDVSITSEMPITSVSAVSWLDTDGTTDLITAPSLGKLAAAGDRKMGVSGDFQADLNLTGSGVSLKSVKVAGELRDSNWNVSGQIGAVKVALMATGSTILSGGNIRSITVGAADALDVLAGVDPLAGRHAVSGSDFTADSRIGGFKATGFKGLAGATFVNSDLSAASLGGVDLLNVDFAAGDDAMAPFGVYAKQGEGMGVGKVRFKDGDGKVWTWGQDGFSAPNGSKLTVADLG